MPKRKDYRLSGKRTRIDNDSPSSFPETKLLTVSSPFTTGSGNPVAGESLQSLLQKLDGNDDAMLQVLGVSQGDTNFGAFSVSSGAAEIIGATSSTKNAFQQIGDEIGIAVVAGSRTNNSVSDQAVNLNITALDSAIGIDSQLNPLTRTVGALVINSSVFTKFDAVDLVIGADSDLTPASRTTGPVAISNNIYANLDALDAAIGVDVTPVTRSNNPIVVANSSNSNIDVLDATIGADADITSTNFITAGGATVYSLFSSLDSNVGKLINKQSLSSVASGNETVIATIPVADAEAVTFYVHAQSGANYDTSIVHSINDGSTSTNTTFADLAIGNQVLKKLTTDVNGGNLRLLADVQLGSTNIDITYIRTPVV